MNCLSVFIIFFTFFVSGVTTIAEKDTMVHETIKILSDYEQLHVLNEVNVSFLARCIFQKLFWVYILRSLHENEIINNTKGITVDIINKLNKITLMIPACEICKKHNLMVDLCISFIINSIFAGLSFCVDERLILWHLAFTERVNWPKS